MKSLPKQGFEPERWSDNTNLSSALYSSVWAAGAIASVPREIAKWSHALYSGNFLGKESMQSMFVTEGRRIGRTRLPMGLGVWKLEADTLLAWGHGGQFHPFLSAMFYVPELGVSFAYSFNSSESRSQSLPGHRLVQTYAANRPDDISTCFM